MSKRRSSPSFAARFAAAGALSVAAVLLTSPDASAHFILDSPASWNSQDALGSPQKLAPCGDDGGTPTGIVTSFQAGQTITITVDETIFHPGHYRIALSVHDRSELPAEPVVTPDASSPCGTTTIESPAVFPVLADGVLLHTSPFSGQQSIQVTLPANVTCEHCTLQVLEFMSNHGLNNPGGCFYHHCADLAITAPAGAGGTGAAGMSAGGSPAAGASGATSAGGAGGTASAGGAAGAATGGTSAATGGKSAATGGAGATSSAGHEDHEHGGTSGAGGASSTGPGGAGAGGKSGAAGQGGAGAGGGASDPDAGGDDGGCSASSGAARGGAASALVLGALGLLARARLAAPPARRVRLAPGPCRGSGATVGAQPFAIRPRPTTISVPPAMRATLARCSSKPSRPK